MSQILVKTNQLQYLMKSMLLNATGCRTGGKEQQKISTADARRIIGISISCSQSETDLNCSLADNLRKGGSVIISFNIITPKGVCFSCLFFAYEVC